MNKLSLALALATGLTLGLAAPSAHADSMIQTLNQASMSASDFNTLFQPLSGAPVMMSPFTYQGTAAGQHSGVMESQVFQGTGAASGLYAYAYQLGVNNQNDANGEPINVQSASWKFNSTPVGTDFTAGSGSTKPGLKTDQTTGANYSYVINGQVGSLDLPKAAPGQTVLAPASLNWEPGTKSGSLVASYVNSAANVPALNAGANSATFVVISNQPFAQQYVNIQSPNPIAPDSPLTVTYAATGGTIAPIPVPEPATVLAWAGMVGAVALVRRVRKNRPAVA